MTGHFPSDDRRSAVWARLEAVTDPELDEALTDLGFIEDIRIAAEGVVDIDFRLPTYWCSANFAFLMADDIRSAVEALPWVARARPFLKDHMTADEVNAGVQGGRSFGEVFSHLGATGTLEDLREKFRKKAFERRQEAVILALRKAGVEAAAICAMTLAAFDAIDLTAFEGGAQKPRYRALLVEKRLAENPGDRAVVAYDGRPIHPEDFSAHMGRLRAVRINMEFNSVLCRGLLESRYKLFDPRSGELGEADPCAGSCGSACASRPKLALVPATQG